MVVFVSGVEMLVTADCACGCCGVTTAWSCVVWVSGCVVPCRLVVLRWSLLVVVVLSVMVQYWRVVVRWELVSQSLVVPAVVVV